MRGRQRAPTRRRVAAALAAAAVLVCVFAGGAGAISVVPQTGSGAIVVDGAVNAVVTMGSSTYLGGSFTHAGQYTGGFASVPVGGGTPTSLPPVNGTVNAIVPDGSGGWYVGGSFSSVGSTSISNLVHITSGGSVDTSWTPSPDQQVDTLALSGGTLYVGGKFATIGGASRSNLAALTVATGVATNWDPEPDGEVTDIAVPSGGTTVYAAGSFANVGSSAHAGLAAISASTGSATTWNPNPSGGAVNALAVSPDGSTVYAGGTFTNIGGNALTRLAAISASTGSSNASWAPAPNSAVNTLALSPDGNTLYVGGTFTLIGSAAQTRNLVAAVSTTNPGNPTSWDPSAVGSSVTAVALSTDGTTAYLGGNFTQVAGQSRLDLAAVSTSGPGTATSWQEDANAAPNAIAATSSAVGVGGTFASVGMSGRSELLGFSSSGSLLDFNPGVSGGAVDALAVSPDSSTLYVGGAFTAVGGQTRSRLAAVSLSTGQTTSWQPASAPPTTVNALAAASVGGDVDVYAGNNGSGATGRLQVFLGSSGAAPPAWNAVATTTGSVLVLALSPDSKTLYVGGSFTNGIGTRIAALDAATGAAAAGWTVPSIGNGSVYALRTSSDGSTLYVGGSFISGSAPANHLFGANSAGTLTFNGNVAGAGTVYVNAMAISGTTIYAGGTFVSTVGANSQTRTRLAALDTTSANATSWNPAPSGGATPNVNAIVATSSGVFAGGTWTSIGSLSLPNFAGFTLSTPSVTTVPGIGGTLALGGTLTCSTGTWSNSPTGYAYQWLRDGSAIGGATASTYVEGTADVGHQLSCQVTATNGQGSASATSASVTIVSTPVNSVAPTVTGTVAVGSSIRCDPGTWTGSPTFSYVWLLDGKAISGVTASSYTPAASDAGHAVACRVTGTNDAGSAIATSAGVVVGGAGGGGSGGPTVVTSGSSVTTGVSSTAADTLTLTGAATISWAAGTFASGTLRATPYAPASDVDGFSRSSPIVSLTFTAPSATVPTPVFLQKSLVLLFPNGVVPRSPYVAYSEDGNSWSPLARLAEASLPAGQLDGYLLRRDGSIVVYTRHTSLYALLRDVQPPSRPATLVATLKGKMLRLRWPPAADNSRRIARYEIVRGKRTVVARLAGSRTSGGISVARLRTASTFGVRAVDGAGNVGRLSPTVTVVVSRGRVSLRP
jgi:hypothetical protein